MSETQKDTFRYDLIRKLGVLSTDKNGWTKEVNVIAFNDKAPVLDIRKWSPNGKMSRGIALKPEEVKQLKEILDTYAEKGEEEWKLPQN